jgi:hypothetical protein
VLPAGGASSPAGPGLADVEVGSLVKPHHLAAQVRGLRFKKLRFQGAAAGAVGELLSGLILAERVARFQEIENPGAAPVEGVSIRATERLTGIQELHNEIIVYLWLTALKDGFFEPDRPPHLQDRQ